MPTIARALPIAMRTSHRTPRRRRAGVGEELSWDSLIPWSSNEMLGIG
jgi:hypothetical protein